jgi:pyridoxal phosphate enzyme (YggS family)
LSANIQAYQQLSKELDQAGATLVAVSKTKPVEDIQELYNAGHRDFGENYVQELLGKVALLPTDTRWHYIGHLQTNKVKLLIGKVQLIHGVDSLKLLKEINKQSGKHQVVTNCLLQVHIAKEETKFGMDQSELAAAMKNVSTLSFVRVMGLMGMASFTDDFESVRNEFKTLKKLFDQYFPGGDGILSMGMSADYKIAIEEGSTLVRIGSLLFGERVVEQKH